MARGNGKFDPEIAEMLDFYKAAAARSDAPVVSSRGGLWPPLVTPHSVA
jgi:hypothetical protein